MNRFLQNLLLLISLYLVYKYAISASVTQIPNIIMSHNNRDAKPDPFEGKDPSQIMVDVNGKKVPLSRIARPHAVLLPDGRDGQKFPDVEPHAKQKEDAKAFDQAVLDPAKQGQKFDAASFPPVEPEAQKREAELEAARAKKNA
ncbi:uncharacterized protein LODBEIA_P45920 [Lodderomyces beijingensis]|uniref:Uncharacterized protein n=1 Tax=Lodderomyces beijingensis TaxID=1775926 RepID=A0ABP0ZRR2_9ASCO